MIYLNGAIEAIATANATPPAPVPGWLNDLIASVAPGACAAGGTFTTGIQINALTSASIKGIRAHWGTGFPPQTVRCSLWYGSGPSAGTLINQEDVTNVVGGTIFQTSLLFGLHTMVPGQQYDITISVVGIANTFAASFTPFPSTYTNYSVVGDQSYRFGSGYGVFPGSASAGNGVYAEPLFL
jgi:hypothetical protein